MHYLGGVAYATHAPRLECAIGMTQVSLCRLSSRFRLSVRSHGLGRSPATPDQPRSGHAGATTATPVAYTAVVCPATQAHRTSPPRGGRRRRPRLAARPSRVTVPAHPQRRRRRPGRRRRCSPPPCLRVAPSSAPSSCASQQKSLSNCKANSLNITNGCHTDEEFGLRKMFGHTVSQQLANGPFVSQTVSSLFAHTALDIRMSSGTANSKAN